MRPSSVPQRLRSFARPDDTVGPVEWMLIAFVGVTALSIAVATVLPTPPAIFSAVYPWAYCVVFAGASALCLIRAARQPAQRAPWALLGLALFAYGTGNVIQAVLLVTASGAPPYPSVADFVWLCFFPLTYLAVVLMLRRMVVRFYLSMLLDGLIAALGVAALTWAVAFGHLIEVSGDRALVVLTNLAYPVGDLLLTAFVVGGVSALGLRFTRTWALVVFGLLTFTLADTLFALAFAEGTYHLSSPISMLWPLAALSLALAAAYSPKAMPKLESASTWWRLVLLPAIFSAASLGLLAYGQINDLPAGAGVLAVGALLAAALRAALTFREVSTLAETRRQARTDELTGLYNRRAFGWSLEEALRKRGPNDMVAVLLIDLDRFKEVNDALGHHVGDELLRLVGDRMTERLGSEGMLARVGGDEFAMLLDHCTVESAEALAERALVALKMPFRLTGITLHVWASIGIAIRSTADDDGSNLLQQADIAMYDAKANGGGFRHYSASRDINTRDRLQTIEQLRESIDRDELVLHYQPMVELASGQVTSVETLVRWEHPTLGLLAPDRFLPLVEQTGLMRALTWHVLYYSLAQVRTWRDLGWEFSVSVNVSASNLLDVELPRTVSALLSRHGVPASALKIEVTESTIMADPARAQQVVSRLDELGVEVAVDDYGTGHSSLAYLRDLAVGTLKLDQSFIQDIATDNRASAIVRSTTELAHSLGLRMVAEGVEDDDSAAMLTGFGCDVGQGYLYSRPLPAPDLERWLRARDAVHVAI
ncbi:MAG: putative bifunctional diguanylate cyclase/phosphodiesterase [Nocardioidaceae bacterium]